jgi:tRNA 2-thiocytidine biosynthesis protein TtcA
MLPLQPMFGGKFEVIRPLAYADQGLIREYAQLKKLPVYENPCPSAHHSRRQYLKNTLEALYASNPKIKGNIFRAMHHVKPDYLPSPNNRAVTNQNRG